MNITTSLLIQSKEQLLNDYIKDKHNQDECIGFIDGMDALIKVLEEMDSGMFIKQGVKNIGNYTNDPD